MLESEYEVEGGSGAARREKGEAKDSTSQD